MFRKRNLVALLMAAMLSLGTMGIAFADGDCGCNYAPVQNEQIDLSSTWA